MAYTEDLILLHQQGKAAAMYSYLAEGVEQYKPLSKLLESEKLIECYNEKNASFYWRNCI